MTGLQEKDFILDSNEEIYFNEVGLDIYLYSTDGLLERFGFPSYEEQQKSDTWDEDHTINFYALYYAESDSVGIVCTVYDAEAPSVKLTEQEKTELRNAMEKYCVKDTGKSLSQYWECESNV